MKKVQNKKQRKISLQLVASIFISYSEARLEVTSKPLQPSVPPSGSGALFQTLTAEQTGVSHRYDLDLKHPLKYLYASAMAVGGVAVGDLNGDGQNDLFFVSGPGNNSLYLQTATWKYQEVGKTAGVDGGEAWGVGAALVDIDGDADLDIYVANYLSANQLFLNNGQGQFQEAAKEWGLDFVDASHTPTFCDYDGDGDLDLYLLTNRWYRPEGFPNEVTIRTGEDGVPRVLPEWEKYYDAVQTGPDQYETRVVGRPDILARNDGGKFSPVTKDAGITHRGHGLSAIWFDWNDDRWPDLWVGNDFNDADRLYENQRDGTFREVTLTAVPYTTWFSMGADVGDMNGDGMLDFYIADMAGSNHYKQKTAMGAMGEHYWFMANARPPQMMRNCLFLRVGPSRFVEAAYQTGLANTNWTWAVRLADLDLDGKNDVYVQAGMSRNFNEKDDPRVVIKGGDPYRTQWDRYEALPPLKEPNVAFRQEGPLQFTDVSKAWGLDHVGMSYGCAMADLDDDGDLDIISARLDEPVALLKNDTTQKNRLALTLRSRGKNTQAVGAEIELQTPQGTQKRVLVLQRGYLGQDALTAVFGLGNNDVGQLTAIVTWPDGSRDEVKNLKLNHHHTLTQTQTLAAKTSLPSSSALAEALFQPATAIDGVRHQERPYPEEYEREPLLPNSNAHWGPAQAWGDLDRDGDLDLYLGAAKYQDRKLFLNDKGTLRPQDDLVLNGSLMSEDQGVLMIDIDEDGDLDLFTVSGSVEATPQDANLQDRLYLNEGRWRFTDATDRLPREMDNGSVAAAADFDRDGDIDIFVGGRCVPGAYPTAATSHLWVNDGAKFTAAAETVMPAKKELGIVSAAVWSDANGDGWLDLLITEEWGPVRLFLNEKGHLQEKLDTNIRAHQGWWNGLTAGDVDADGDIDYVATNFGLNTKYHPTDENPALIYYGDLDDSGKCHIVEAEYEDQREVPIRGKSCSSAAMPFIKKKFETYHSFALATVQEIYSPEKLSKVKRYHAGTLATSLLRNDGTGRFTLEPLPDLAQLAPAFGAVIEDVTGDAHPDILLAQNFYHPQIETGRMSGGVGALLKNNGAGKFTTMWPDQSGILLSVDARSAILGDRDGDGRREWLVAENDGPLYEQKLREKEVWPVLELKSPKSSQRIGARVQVSQGKKKCHHEFSAGSGYLSQAMPLMTLSGLEKNAPTTVRVQWADGEITEKKFKTLPARVIISRE